MRAGIATSLPSAAVLGIVAGLLSACASTGGGKTMQSSPQGAEMVGINAQPGSEKDFMLNVGRRTFFTQGSAELDDTARVTLDKQAQWLQQYPQWKIKLQGFADDPGSLDQQKTLSQKRADAVRQYLASRGIGADRMLAKGYGRDRLVAECQEIECKAQNRRVITNPQDAPDF